MGKAVENRLSLERTDIMQWYERVKEIQVAVLGLCLMLGLVAGTAILGSSLVEFKRSADDIIAITGAASEILPSDRAEWRATFGRNAKTLAEAYAAVQNDVTIMRKYLTSHDIPEQAITIQPLSTEIVYVRTSQGDNTNEVDGYTLRQTIIVESENVDLIEKLVAQSNELIRQGIVLESSYPQYFYTRLDDIKIKMLRKATENAKARARAMAEATGNGIGLMKSAKMGVFQITDKNSTEVSDGGMYDTSAKIKKVTAVVNVAFAVR